VEADLWIRLNPDKAADAMVARTELAGFSRTLLLQQIREYNLLYKPTYMYPLGRFWGLQNQDIAMWLHVQGKLKKALVREDYEAYFAAAPMNHVFNLLGWKVPKLPPYIGEDWLSKSGRVKLPAYDTYLTMKAPQPWPERGDLTKPFKFGDKTYTP
jgi:hypothetical protein